MKQKKYDSENVIKNVRVLQRASSSNEFFVGQFYLIKCNFISSNLAAVLLDQYLRNSTDEATYTIWKEFSDYWIDKFQENEYGQLEATPSAVSGWFEGYSPHVSTNNGLESINEKLKTRESMRRKLPLHSFLEVVNSSVYHFISCPDHKASLLSFIQLVF
jgi:hypothetical protein